ncbi:MAG: methylglyoxal synthase [Deferribacteraceae bacterium]|jgi:methylglyoxal synthase|nr:methylglyoxal synthase [Deferribacteraceae bacterium]
MKRVKRIALVAHDNQKRDIVDWVERNADILRRHKLISTGTTGRLILEMLNKTHPDDHIDITLLKSGPLGGDQQIGAMICNQEIDFLIFLTDPMTPQPHDVDVKALVRVAVIYNIIMACNLASADFAIHSTLFDTDYTPQSQDYSKYLRRDW